MSNHCPHLQKRAFTLIELLIVVAIIGILAAIAVPNFINAQLKAKISRVAAEERSIASGYLMYRLDNNKYPPHIDGDPAQHRFVTTPVAYLSTSVWDIFADPNRKNEWPWECCTVGQYHCEPAYFAFQQNSSDPIRSDRNAAYFVLSYGPDQVFDGESYNSTNGLISAGNIIASVEGEFRDGFPYTKANY
ncbi:MAG: prepilin-type N-terminal cleavage/methylation domain-containing protein [Candidatus Omnitrophota bacterium]|jgi:prepilin-type N-terminal cleavage/methylation domain-containing protein|nr:MAG: prepilin-type N-terminal cleavage/methylation domain-containing protein [Candidatus Omnitrophota bacterium]